MKTNVLDLPSDHILKLEEVFLRLPEPFDIVWTAFGRGTVGLLLSETGLGKSMWCLQAACAVASGIPSTDLLQIQPSEGLQVAFFSLQNGVKAITNRLHNIGLQLTAKEQLMITHNLRVTCPTFLDILSPETQHYIKDLAEDCGLIIFDSLSQLHNLDPYNAVDMHRVFSALAQLAQETNAAILVTHYLLPNPTFQSTYREQVLSRLAGSPVIADHCHYIGYLLEGADEINYGVLKSNYHGMRTFVSLQQLTSGVFKEIPQKELLSRTVGEP